MCCSGISARSADVTRDQAILLVQNNRFTNNLSNSTVRFYAVPTDTVINNYRCRVNIANAQEWIRNDTPKWLVFVDEQPQNPMWSHPCRYYYVPRQCSQTTIPVVSYEGQFKPDIHGLYCPDLPQQSVIIGTDTVCNNITYNEPLNGYPVYPSDGGLHIAIIAGGQDFSDNNITFYNDTKFLYNVLRNKYNIDKNRVHVFLADGGRDSIDMNDLSGNIARVSTDLDGDGVSDIEKAATADNIDSLFTVWSETLTAKDHVLLVFDSHGGKDGDIHIWGGSYYTRDCLRDVLDSIHSATQCLIINTCFSGNQINKLKSDKRVILTSAGYNEVSYGDAQFNFFIHEWTSAINEADTKCEVYSDSICNGWVSMSEAFNYAKNQDNYEYETINQVNPQNASKCSSLCDDWAINHLPDPTALYIRDSNKQNDNGLDGYYDSGSVGYNVSPDIVVSPIDNEPGKLAIKVTIRNRGYKQYDGTSRYLHLHWKPSTYSDDRSNWIGRVTNLMKNAPEFAILQIEDSIGSGGETTVETIWNLPPRLLDAEGAYNNTQFDILARVSDSSQPVIRLSRKKVGGVFGDLRRICIFAAWRKTFLNSWHVWSFLKRFWTILR